jgi:general secretion pathway protein J
MMRDGAGRREFTVLAGTRGNASRRVSRLLDGISGSATCRGFTLLEVLIAIAIVAVIAVLGYRALASLSDAETRLAAEATRWRTLDLFFARLEGDMREAMPRSARSGAVREAPWLGAVIRSGGNDGDSAVAFSRAGPEFNIEPGSAGQRLGYRLREGTVEVLYWPSFDRPQDAPATSYALLTDVTRFRLIYLARNNAWVESWPIAGDADLPRAVRVQLTLSSGETLERWLALRP